MSTMFISPKCAKCLIEELSNEEIDFLKEIANSHTVSCNITYPPVEQLQVEQRSLEEFTVDYILHYSEQKSLELLLKVSNILRGFVEEDLDIISKHFYYQEEVRLFYKHRDEGYLDKAIEACEKQIEYGKEAIEEFRTKKVENAHKLAEYREMAASYRKYINAKKHPTEMWEKFLKGTEEHIYEILNHKFTSVEDYSGPVHIGYKQLCIIYEKRGEYEKAIKIAKQALSEHWGGDWGKRISRMEKRIKR